MAAPARRARQALSRQLRELRLTTGATGSAFAGRLGAGWAQPKVSKIETGKQLPTAADLEAWAAATGAETADLLDLLERARVEYATFKELYAQAGGPARLQDALAVAEAAATRIAVYQPVLVPGLLQTAEYAREMLRLPGGPGELGADEEEIGRMIASRLRRQAILYEPGREIILLLGEGALRTRVASPATMRAQCEHIAHLAETLTTATVGVAPFAAPAPIAVLNGWQIEDDLVSIETDGGDLEIADPEEVAGYWRNTRLLLEAAATDADAAALCRRIGDEIGD